jgi:non-specific serine/threonine protein kinase/serine/threonine-protein kinase
MQTPDWSPDWSRVKPILEQALDTPTEARAAFLDGACAGDPGLRAEVESLLAFDDGAADPPVLDLPDGPDPGWRLGPWRVLHEIGRGGMGVVYLAERADDLFEKQVAVKILESVLSPAELVRRFEAERRILATLDHPSIAALLDAGHTPDGKPYFVLEYVEGRDLSAWLDARKPDLRRKLDLFLRICDAVSWAHRRLIVHLDLKPGNILVTAEGAPKLLDFGIARILDPSGAASSQLTGTVFGILTPGYASPEQFSGAPVTVASDVYSLGVILYRMLTGRLPHDTAGLSPTALVETITSHEPAAPALGRDLDAIVLKAIAKDASARYRSADDLAADLGRYLAGEPVLARKSSRRYRAGKFVRRHKLSLAAAALALSGILIGAGIAVRQARIAQRRFDQVRQVANSFLFEFHDAIQDLPGATPARELVLRRAAEYLDSLAADSAGDARLKRELAESYMKLGEVQGLYFEANLGQSSDARRNFGKAVALLESAVAGRPYDISSRLALGEAHLRLASALSTSGDPAEGLRALDRASAIARSFTIPLPPARILLAKAHFGRAENFERMNRLDDALAARRDCLDVLIALDKFSLGNRSARRWLAQAHKRMGATLLRMNRATEAMDHITAADKIDRDLLAADPSSATAKADLALDASYRARALDLTGQPEAAIATLRTAVDLQRAVYESDPRNQRALSLLISGESALGNRLLESGKTAEGCRHLQTARALDPRTVGQASACKGL